MENKLRVLFDVCGNQSWIGGVYYMRNIIFQITISSDLCNICTPVIICNTKFEYLFKKFSEKAEIITYKSKFGRFVKLLKVIGKIDKIYNYSDYKFDIFNLLRKKAIYWIPDFQEKYYPEFFTDAQLQARKVRELQISKSTAPLVLSSKSCLDDFEICSPEKVKGKICIVPFVSNIEDEIQNMDIDYSNMILKKYGLSEKKFVLISNQFWRHKNHVVVFQAIVEAKRTNRLKDILFVFTGELERHRDSEHYKIIKDIIESNHIQSKVMILGFIGRKEQIILMHQALVLLQPSLFEGWGTVVEDGKVLDKTIVLSDIPVHREQMNEKCILFAPKNEKDLLSKLEKAISGYQADNVQKGIEDMYKRAGEYVQDLKILFNEIRSQR